MTEEGRLAELERSGPALMSVTVHQVALGALALTLLCQGRHRPRIPGSRKCWGKRLTISRSSYIIAAIERVVHHSVILDMMGVVSYRAEAANLQLLRQQEEAKQKPVEVVVAGTKTP